MTSVVLNSSRKLGNWATGLVGILIDDLTGEFPFITPAGTQGGLNIKSR